MTWNYRIIKSTEDELGEKYHFLAEVFYNEDGSLMGFSEGTQAVGESQEEVIEVLEMMLKDAKRLPVIDEKEFYTGKKGNSDD
jgi:hypothetical protein